MSDKMPDAWIVPSASGDGYLCTLSHVNLPGWNRYVPAARIAELEAELAAERWRREDIRANERRALREKLICAALTGLMGQTSASETWYAERAISQADAVLDALDREAAK